MNLQENNWKNWLKKWWLHIILVSTQFYFGIIVNYSLYKFLSMPADQGCGMPMFGILMAHCFLLFMAFIPLLIRMEYGRGFARKHYWVTILLLLINPLIFFGLFFV